MLKKLRFAILALPLLAAWVILPQSPMGCAHAAGCGILPLKPLTPLGCKDLKPQCVCNTAGDKCTWEWVCVK